jgi:ABC-type branched-subunit amino acid transport system substrate-binding protein
MNATFTPLAQFICLLGPALLMCWTVPCRPSHAVAAVPIKVGAVLPFSGGVELYGNQAKLGLDLAAKEINATGGILGRPLTILYEDDKTDPEVAEKATRQLIERDGVLAVVGPITSRNLNAITATIERAKTPLLFRNVDKEGLVDALEGLVIQSPTGRVTIGKNHHVTMNMFLAMRH